MKLRSLGCLGGEEVLAKWFREVGGDRWVVHIERRSLGDLVALRISKELFGFLGDGDSVVKSTGGGVKLSCSRNSHRP